MNIKKNNNQEVIIAKKDEGKTIFAYLKKNLPIAFVHKLFRKNGFRLNNLRIKDEKTILQTGDKIKFFLNLEKKPEPQIPNSAQKFSAQTNYKLNILFENQDFAVINKDPGIAMQAWTDVVYEDTLEYKLKNYFQTKNEKIFLVHRLDKDTSGCLIIAKTEPVQADFEKMLREGQIKKEYLTLVKGHFQNKKGAVKIKLPGRQNNLVSALTFYELDKYFPQENLSLIKAKIKTGRKHQIRLHFAKIGHPVVLDKKYGDFKFNKYFSKKYHLYRQFLHAYHLAFEYKNTQIDLKSPLTYDLEKTLKSLH
ncbi:MAG: ribosomal large subunit pseudouridine synthase C [Candidatus Peregrinibacteria bacterium GW2011_GWF2_33_10]|nr:MAG: ribosomal large subunit pseudouridine synthase C [Candidatus Peregrinibacteria bacterium GW2011_GWF2_33_10]OGJ44950.1 MAG: hypothetical protein A2272_02805 [Candidatus Peregrinibacteria bacterium RIFOXYA12_FULL_33_12]OGJ45248.1 MAG: hypothetical protein A2263_06780 [Candidatus Peregrinibacteria bacterium RIFOXYA2_FULL_33_21]OGJ51172.1 MAG: hypothetical protein A2307_04865 [Candidatus Peregrinibacteria bacterium RIFOXYB2_FULL_33_20]